MASWRDISQSDKFQKLTPREQQVEKLKFFNDVVLPSPKYKQTPPEEQNKVFQDFFPGNEYQNIMVREATSGLIKEFKNLPGIKQGDVAVEEFAKFVEPEVPAGRTTPGLLIKDLPRQIGAEFIRGWKPSTILPFLGAAKLAKPILKPVGKAIWDKVPQKYKDILLKEMTIGKGQPLEYQQAARTAKLGKAAGAREAEQVAKTLSVNPLTGKSLTGEEQRYVGRLFRKETIESPQILAQPKYQQLKSVSDEGRAVMDKWSNELIKSGIPSKEVNEVIKGNLGTYMARMFDKNISELPLPFASKSIRLKLNGLKHRKQLSDDVLKLMGEIKEPALPTAIRVKELSTSVVNQKLFNTVAKNPEWSSVFPQPNMVKMPSSASVGPLKNRWVVKEIADDINAITSIQKENIALKLYSKGLSAWKYGKVVLNPATHTRNILSNTILLDLSGTNHFRQMQLFPTVVKDYVSKGKLYQMALEDGAIGGEFVGSEVGKIYEYYNAGQGGHLSKLLNTLKIPFRKASDIYQGEEQLAKLIKYQDVLLKGGTRQAAAQEAQKWLFNYTEVPNFIQTAKQVAPFITFTYKSLPRLGETLVNNPLKLYKYKALFNAWNTSAQKTLGMNPVEFAKQKKLLPDWLMQSVGGVPANLLMPYRDKYNRTQWLNLEYILPIGMAPEIMEQGLKGIVTNPAITLVGDLIKGTDFRGRPIVSPQSEQGDAIRETLGYIYRQLAPSFAPGLFEVSGEQKGEDIFKGGYSFDKVLSAFYKRPDYADRVRDIPPALLDTLLGLKITPLDIKESETFRIYDKKKKIDDLTKQLFKLQHPAISEKTKQREREKIFKAIQKTVSEIK